MTEWINCKLSDIGEVVGGATPSTKDPENYDGEIAWITPKDLSTFTERYIDHGERSITEKGYKSCSTRMLPVNSVLFSSRAPIGYVAIASKEMCTNQGFKSIIPNEKVDYLFLYYLLKYKKDAIEGMGSGTTFKEVSGNVMKGIEVRIPKEIPVQKRIAEILDSMDSKIENNNAINRNLSEQSQLVVRFYMERTPYEMKPLAEIAEIIDCLHSKKPSAIEDGRKQLIQLDNITDYGFLDLEAMHYMISDADYEFWTRKCEIVAGDCVITNVGRVGAVSQAPAGTHAAMGRNMTCIRLKPECPWYSYIITLLLSDHMKREITRNTDVGTIMDALNVKDIPKLLFPIFEFSEMNKLEQDLRAIRGLIEGNYLENQRLAHLRDTLLPKLMSGELDVSSLPI